MNFKWIEGPGIMWSAHWSFCDMDIAITSAHETGVSMAVYRERDHPKGEFYGSTNKAPAEIIAHIKQVLRERLGLEITTQHIPSRYHYKVKPMQRWVPVNDWTLWIYMKGDHA